MVEWTKWLNQNKIVTVDLGSLTLNINKLTLTVNQKFKWINNTQWLKQN